MSDCTDSNSADTWKPDQFEKAFVAELGLSHFVPLKTILMVTPDDHKVYLFRNWSTLMFLGQAHLLLGSVHHHVHKLAAGETDGLAAVILRALFGSIVLSLRAGLDSLAGEVDLLLCDGEPDAKIYVEGPPPCSLCHKAVPGFRKRLKEKSKQSDYAKQIKGLLAEMDQAKWYQDLRDYRNEVGHRLPGFLWLDPCGPGPACFDIHLMKPKLDGEKIWALFSNYVEPVKPEPKDLAEPEMMMNEQLQHYLIKTSALVDSVWGVLLSHLENQSAGGNATSAP